MNNHTQFRRNEVRRQKERRTNQFPFNSPEWVAMMRASFELWPKHDRRETERRAADRRKLERRAIAAIQWLHGICAINIIL